MSGRGVARIGRWVSPETFRGRVVRAGFWAGGLRAADRIVGLVRTTVLANLLAPHDFGLFGITLLMLTALESFSRPGLQPALIHQRGDVDGYLDTAWTIQLVRGLVLAALMFAAAPFVATFFEEPATEPLIRTLALAFVIQGATNIGVVLLDKELRFGRRFAYRFSGTCTDLVVTIAVALVLRSAWALVVGMIVANAVRVIASFVAHPYRPRFAFDRERAAELLGYGKWVWWTGVVGFLVLHGDDALVGKVVGASGLAFYQMAFLFATVAATELTRVISQVALPAFAKVQDQRDRLSVAFLRALGITLSVGLPVGLVLIILAPDFVPLLLGDDWRPIVHALQILTVAAVLRGVIATGAPLYQSIGRPHLAFWINVVRLGAMVAPLYPFTVRWGIEGAAAAVTIGVVAAAPIWWVTVSRVLNLDARAVLSRIAVVVAASAPMGIALVILRVRFAPLGFAGLVGLVAVAAALYLGVAWALLHCGRLRGGSRFAGVPPSGRGGTGAGVRSVDAVATPGAMADAGHGGRS